MSASPFVVTEDRGTTRIIRLNRPEKKNSFNIGQAVAFRDALGAAQDDTNVRVIIWTGSGDAFSAGADMNTFAGRDTSGDPGDIRWVGNLHEAFLKVEKPVIAAVNGLAIGMGVTLLGFCDIVYAADTATFSTPFARLGIVLEYASSWILPRLIGRQRASEMALRATPIDARTAYDWGLVNRIFPRAELLDRAIECATDIEHNGPRAVRLTKQLLLRGEEIPTLQQGFDEEQKVLATCYGSEEHMKQVMAFFARKQKV